MTQIVNREPIFAALWNLLLTVPPPPGMTWALRGRRLLHWTQCPSQPAMFLQEQHQEVDQPTFGTPQWKWHAIVWIYFKTDNSLTQDSYPDLVINQMLDAVESTLRTTADLPLQTLGNMQGLLHCYIKGTIAFDAGVLDKQAVIAIPIELIVGA